MLKKLFGFVTLFGSMSTLICCALPALFVSLGAGAVLASLVSQFPQLIWISEHKKALFLLTGILLAIGGYAQWHSRSLPCPIDPRLAKTCRTARRTSFIVYIMSLLIYLTGAGFAFLPELLIRS